MAFDASQIAMGTHSLFEKIVIDPQAGADWADIEVAERDLGRTRPEDYRVFLRSSNGLEGFEEIGDVPNLNNI
ncbi:MAG TPA: hypothetical protein VN328_04625 [Thermodesulfovibrionales bacterium]|nr:hypothetical protein [Thermodesulfovibrionales bacterium]